MTNGVLMQAGLDAIGVPARARRAFNKAMVRLHDQPDGREMGDLWLGYAPAISIALNPRSRGVGAAGRHASG